MEGIAIKVDNVTKTFKLPHEKSSSVKGSFVGMFRRKKTYERQEVLQNVSFEIKKGEFFGIVGRNGSGKSTLLKLLSGIYSPDHGQITINGKLTPFIELGVGFNPELTGRENVYLNGALLGFSRKEMSAMYDDIVAFAELEQFMDQRLKNYSSGMHVRLAFAIAIRANSDILLLDEVLAVGDEAFQRKCYDYFETLKRNKKTVILVTHEMSAVERFCTKAMLVENGKIKMISKPQTVAAAYSRSNDESYRIEDATTAIDSDSSYQKSNISIILKNKLNEPEKKFTANDSMKVHIGWDRDDVQHVGVAVFRQNGDYIFGTNTYIDKIKLNKTKKLGYLVDLNLSEGMYYLQVGLFGEQALRTIEFEERGPVFAVSRNKNDARWVGVTKLSHSWEQI
jgi:ABC-2 type transport system ATP-binding protein